jgi:hypothetical protein
MTHPQLVARFPILWAQLAAPASAASSTSSLTKLQKAMPIGRFFS